MPSTRPPASLLGYALVAIAAMAWGTWPLILRRAEAIAPMSAELEAAITMAVVTLGSAPLCLRDRLPNRAPRGRRAWLGVAWLGIADALNVVCFFRAYQLTSVAVAVLTHYCAPVFVAMAAPLVLRERRSVRTYIAVLVSFAGLVFLLRPWSAERHASDGTGALFGTASAVFYASSVLVNKRLSADFSGSELVFFHGAFATPLLVVLAGRSSFAAVNLHAVGVLAMGAVYAGAVAGVLFVWGLRRVPASHASNLTLLEPLVAVLAAAGILGERIGREAVLGAALILLGAVLVVSSSKSVVTSR